MSARGSFGARERLALTSVVGWAVLTLFLTMTPVERVSPVQFWSMWAGTMSGVDAVQNVVLFLPLGWFAHRGGWSAWRCILAGLVFSAGIEFAQQWVHGRTSTASDIVFNTTGAALGWWMASPARHPRTRTLAAFAALAGLLALHALNTAWPGRVTAVGVGGVWIGVTTHRCDPVAPGSTACMTVPNTAADGTKNLVVVGTTDRTYGHVDAETIAGALGPDDCVWMRFNGTYGQEARFRPPVVRACGIVAASGTAIELRVDPRLEREGGSWIPTRAGVWLWPVWPWEEYRPALLTVLGALLFIVGTSLLAGVASWIIPAGYLLGLVILAAATGMRGPGAWEIGSALAAWLLAVAEVRFDGWWRGTTWRTPLSSRFRNEAQETTLTAHSAEMLEALFQDASQFMGVLDAEGRVLACNRMSLPLLGTPADEIRDRPLWESPVWSSNPALQLRVRDAITETAKGQFVRIEVTHPDADGRDLTVDFFLTPCRDAAGQVRWLLAEGRDVTERRQMEDALKESEAKFREIFQKSQDGILLLDGDRFIECNPEVLKMMRCSQPELLRMHPWDLSPPVQPDGRSSGEKALEMIQLAHEQGGHRFEWMHRRIDGEDFPVEVTLTPFPLMGHEVLYTTWRDITDRKREEAERLELERRVLHMQKLESLGILAGGIAHDFNNLMTAMTGRLELARTMLSADHAVHEQLIVFDDILRRATNLTGQMLAYAGKGRFVVGPTDLNHVVREMNALIAPLVSKDVRIELDLTADVPCVDGDIAQLQQVLVNLVTNASDAIGGEPGRIRISTGMETLDLAATVGLRADSPPSPGPYVFLEVSDTGCGITLDVQHRMFEPFFSTKGTGRGLGLSAMLGILRSHHGAFRMDTAPGAGSTFRLYFPSAGAPVVSSGAAPDVRREVASGLRVLLVEDEEIIREVSARLISRLGYVVVPAVDGLDALEKLATGAPFAVVMLDLTMPRMDGRQVLAVIAKDYPTLPVVLCSGYSAEEIEGGWNGVFLPKPYSLDALKNALGTVLAGVG